MKRALRLMTPGIGIMCAVLLCRSANAGQPLTRTPARTCVSIRHVMINYKVRPTEPIN